jgi:hypothetical protein
VKRSAVLTVTAAFIIVATAGCSSGDSSDAVGFVPNDSSSGPNKAVRSIGKDDPAKVSRADMGKKWPLTLDKGRLLCIGSRRSGALVFVAPDGKNYALNGTAKAQLDHADIDTIWADAGGGLKKDLGPLINRGLKLC